MTHELITPTEQDAQAIERDAGYILAQVIPGALPVPIVSIRDWPSVLDQAPKIASLRKGQTIGVFKLVRDFTVPRTAHDPTTPTG